jgi:hypothetical protein
VDLLDEYSAGLPQDKKDQLLKDNFMKLNQYSQFTGLELLTTVQRSGAVAQNSTSPVDVGYNGSFQSSGGLIVISGSVLCYSRNNIAQYVLSVDGLAVQTKLSGVSGDQAQQVPFFYAGPTPAGKHKISLTCARLSGSANNIDTGYTGVIDGFYVLEYRKG